MFDSFWLFVHHREGICPIMLLAYILLAHTCGVWIEGRIRMRIVGEDSFTVKVTPRINSPESKGLRLDATPAQAPPQTVAGLGTGVHCATSSLLVTATDNSPKVECAAFSHSLPKGSGTAAALFEMMNSNTNYRA